MSRNYKKEVNRFDLIADFVGDLVNVQAALSDA